MTKKWPPSPNYSSQGWYFFKKSIWGKTQQPLFLHSQNKFGIGLAHGVMVTLLILVQSFKVRILMGQQNNEKAASQRLYFLPGSTLNNKISD